MSITILPVFPFDTSEVVFLSFSPIHLYRCISLVVECLFGTQEKLSTIAGSVAKENNIRHYIKAMALWISAILQLGYLPINRVGHFMTHLYIKHTGVDMGFVTWQLHIVRHIIPLCTSRFSKCLNNAFNNKMGTHDSKMHTSLKYKM